MGGSTGSCLFIAARRGKRKGTHANSFRATATCTNMFEQHENAGHMHDHVHDCQHYFFVTPYAS